MEIGLGGGEGGWADGIGFVPERVGKDVGDLVVRRFFTSDHTGAGVALEGLQMVSCVYLVRQAERERRWIYQCHQGLGAGSADGSVPLREGVSCTAAGSALGTLAVLMLASPTPGKDYHIND